MCVRMNPNTSTRNWGKAGVIERLTRAVLNWEMQATSVLMRLSWSTHHCNLRALHRKVRSLVEMI